MSSFSADELLLLGLSSRRPSSLELDEHEDLEPFGEGRSRSSTMSTRREGQVQNVSRSEVKVYL